MHPQTLSPVMSTTSMAIGHGPPPSYDAVVAMDQEMDGCDKCAKRWLRQPAAQPTSVICSCPLHKFEPEEDDTRTQILNVTDLHSRTNSSYNPEAETAQRCNRCSNRTDSGSTESSCGACYVDADNNLVESSNQRRTSTESRQSNEASTSSTSDNHRDMDSDQNGNQEVINQQANDNGNSTTELNSINNNGLIRVDMSQIIDRTGLPTYEAALKFESSGYV